MSLNIGYITSISLVVTGILTFFYFATRKKLKIDPAKPIKHYEEKIDKLTTRKKEEVVESGEFNINIGGLISGFIVILVGASLVGPIANQINLAVNESQLTNVTNNINFTFLTTIPTFFIITIALVAIAIAFNALRSSGLTGL